MPKDIDSAPADKPGSSAASAPPFPRDPLDHDGDGRKGGVAPVAAVQHLAVIKDDAERRLVHGQVIAVSAADAKLLLATDHVRIATDVEVELARPFVHSWTA